MSRRKRKAIHITEDKDEDGNDGDTMNVGSAAELDEADDDYTRDTHGFGALSSSSSSSSAAEYLVANRRLPSIDCDADAGVKNWFPHGDVGLESRPDSDDESAIKTELEEKKWLSVYEEHTFRMLERIQTALLDKERNWRQCVYALREKRYSLHTVNHLTRLRSVYVADVDEAKAKAWFDDGEKPTYSNMIEQLLRQSFNTEQEYQAWFKQNPRAGDIHNDKFDSDYDLGVVYALMKRDLIWYTAENGDAFSWNNLTRTWELWGVETVAANVSFVIKQVLRIKLKQYLHDLARMNSQLNKKQKKDTVRITATAAAQAGVDADDEMTLIGSDIQNQTALQTSIDTYNRIVAKVRKQLTRLSCHGASTAVRKASCAFLVNRTIEEQMNRTNKHLLPIQKGMVIDLTTCRTRYRRVTDLFSTEAPVEYIPRSAASDDDRAQCEDYLLQFAGQNGQFVDEQVSVADSQELADWLKVFFGYCLTAETSDRRIYIPIGSGLNGKSVFMEEMMHAILGDEFWKSCHEKVLVEAAKASDSSATPELVKLLYARTIVYGETKENARLNSDRVKKLTDANILSGRDVYKSIINFKLQVTDSRCLSVCVAVCLCRFLPVSLLR